MIYGAACRVVGKTSVLLKGLPDGEHSADKQGLNIGKKKYEICTILIPKGNSYCRRKSSARGPRFKVSSIGLSAEIDKCMYVLNLFDGHQLF